MGIWCCPAFAGFCDPLPFLHGFLWAGDSFKHTWRGVWDCSRMGPPTTTMGSFRLGPDFRLLLLSLIPRHRFWILWLLHHLHCFGWIEQLVPASRFRFPTISPCRCWCFSAQWRDALLFYVLKQHTVCSQLLKLTQYLRICLNGKSYRKCKFITSHLILTIDFWGVLWGFFLLVLSLLCLHAYADFPSLPEPHNTCYQ